MRDTKRILRKQTMLGRALRLTATRTYYPTRGLRKQTMLGRALRLRLWRGWKRMTDLHLRKQTMLGRALRRRLADLFYPARDSSESRQCSEGH